MSGRLHVFGAALLLFGCAAATTEPPDTQTAIRRFYEAHASENIGQCLAPYIDGFTTLRVVESDPERMVVDARYMYRDWIKDERASAGQRIGNPCVGYGERRFVLAKIDGIWRVEQMSGPQRGQRSASSANPRPR
jgi:hypothetical protein